MAEGALIVTLAFLLVDDWGDWKRGVVTVIAVVLAGVVGRALGEGGTPSPPPG